MSTALLQDTGAATMLERTVPKFQQTVSDWLTARGY